MERFSVITHKNVKMIFVDCKNLSENEICILIDKFTDYAIANKITRYILDVTGTHTTPNVKEVATKASQRSSAQLGKVYSSLIGLSTMQRIIANAIFRDQYFATNLEDAKNWLAAKNSLAA